ncbi:prephenate dehydratase [bacterium]|nr:prephenate dehydratase [bacterium]
MDKDPAIGCLGPEGTFSDHATQQWIKWQRQPHRIHYYHSIPSLIQGVETGEVARAVVPVENAIEGPVHAALDHLAVSKQSPIQCEFLIPVALCLFALHPTKLSEIRCIASHIQPLGQCEQFIHTHFDPLPDLHGMPSTAKAASELVSGTPSFSHGNPLSACAIIGGQWLGPMFGLHPIAENIQDMKHNQTRFWVIGNPITLPNAPNKTSVVFTLPQHVPGALERALSVFTQHQINLSSIASRPTKTRLGAYRFFVDAAHDGQSIHEVISELKTVAQDVSWLGTYPCFQEISDD